MPLKRFDKKPDGTILPNDYCRDMIEMRTHEDCPGAVMDLETHRLYTCCYVCNHHRKHLELYGDGLGDAS